MKKIKLITHTYNQSKKLSRVETMFLVKTVQKPGCNNDYVLAYCSQKVSYMPSRSTNTKW